MGYQRLSFEIVLEGYGFDVFLDAGGYLTLVAPSVHVREVGDQGGEEGVDGGVVGICGFCDGRGEWRSEGTGTAGWER